MTEAEWLKETDPTPMLEFLRGKASDRKLRLFAVACCRRHWHLLNRDVLRPGLKVIERYANNKANDRELEATHLTALRYGRRAETLSFERQKEVGRPSLEADLLARDSHLAYLISFAAQRAEYLDGVLRCTTVCKAREVMGYGYFTDQKSRDEWRDLYEADGAVLARLLREIIANPFRPITVARSWLTSTVISLARLLYKSRDFSPMPILADALQDAGCDNEDILNHCRQPGEHVRGCWVVDLVLGKS